MIVGIAVGVAVGVIAMGITSYCCIKRYCKKGDSNK